MRKFYNLSFIIFMGLLFLTAWVSMGIRGVSIYLDVLSIMLVLLCSIILLMANFSLSDIRKYFVIGFNKDTALPSDLKNGILFFSSLQKYLILSGVLGSVMGLIAILSMLEEPQVVGQSLALALITALYAIILSMVIAIPFKTGLQKRLNEISK